MPSAPAKAASTTPRSDWDGARRHVATHGSPPTVNRLPQRTRTTRAPVRRAGRWLATSSNRAAAQTEPDIARRPVADHRVQRIDRTIGQHAGHSRPKPKQRRHMRIRRVLGDRLQTCTRQPIRIEHRRIPTTQGGQQLRASPTRSSSSKSARRSPAPARLTPATPTLQHPPRAPSSHGSAASRPPASQCAGTPAMRLSR